MPNKSVVTVCNTQVTLNKCSENFPHKSSFSHCNRNKVLFVINFQELWNLKKGWNIYFTRFSNETYNFYSIVLRWRERSKPRMNTSENWQWSKRRKERQHLGMTWYDRVFSSTSEFLSLWHKKKLKIVQTYLENGQITAIFSNVYYT